MNRPEHELPESEVEDALRRQVDRLHDAPLSLASVQRRARGIRRRRTALAVVAAAAAVAVVVPVGLTLTRPGADPGPTVSTPTTGPTTGPAGVPTYTVDVTPSESQVSGDELAIPYWYDGELIAPDGSTLDVADPVDEAVLDADGAWSGPQLSDVGWNWTSLDATGRVLSGDPSVNGQVGITPDGSRWAYLAMTPVLDSEARAWTAELRGSSQTVTSWAVPGDITGDSGVAGILSDDSVVVTGSRGRVYLARPSGSLDRLAGKALLASAVSTATDRIAVQTSYRDDGTSCWALVDSEGQRQASTCDWTLDEFSADGQWLVGRASESDGPGPAELAILDTTTLRPVALFRAPHNAFFGEVAWEGDHLVASMQVARRGTWYVERLSRDGIRQISGFGARTEYGAPSPVRFGAGPLEVSGR